MSGLDARIVVRRDEFALDLDLTIAQGTTAALLGPNGSGKSTTLGALAGLVALDEGHVELVGRTLDRPEAGIFVPPEDRRIGVVFQEYLLFDHLDVLDNVAFGPMSAGMRRRDARAAAEQWIDALDLDGLRGRRSRDLSGGQAQRVAVARALATEPELFLLDEPMAALDVGTRSRLRRLMRGVLAELSAPTLLITHDPADAYLLADEIHVLENGRISQSGTADEIRRHPSTPYVAALAGTNLLTGTSSAGVLTLDDHPRGLQASDTTVAGPVLITIHPTAIALHPDEPHGSPRNTWHTTVADVEPLGDTTRITLDTPLPLSVDITPAATAALGLAPGSPVWASVKATEIGVTPAAG